MLNSMTGFGSKEKEISPFGKITVELRSTNHKFLETVLHMPEGFLSLEDKIKREIESKIKRGRITCAINIAGGRAGEVCVNKDLLKNYLCALKTIQKQFQLKDEVRIDTLIHLPGVLSLKTGDILKGNIWPQLKLLVNEALSNLMKMRQKEGRALFRYLRSRAGALKTSIDFINTRFNKAIKDKAKRFKTDEERSSFLKNSDITEEIERLIFHIRNFKTKLSKNGPIGKELDFIAQEMQREANTLAAKTFDTAISARIVQIKSQIEKVREQVQNIE
ncbi:MAG: YicC family protein [Candidatus Omnitrophica bacterium]|nr:YicC family protein [Candidatus Omnitrophota bacterium]MBU1869346.1 YicC family protein [Candidatus Omnitrophota bacterium]